MTKRTPIQLSDHFTYERLLRFVAPSVIMMIFTSIYSVVDGLFVSNFVGKTQFAAINLVMPLIIIVGAIGFMLGVGGTAIVAKTLGMGDKKKANEYFSLLIYTSIISGVVIAALGIIFARPVSMLLGAEGDMLDYCSIYASIVLITLPCFMLQNMFQSFCITAEKPKLGLIVTVSAGITNIILDALFVGLLRWGLEGAAAATCISQTVGAIIPLVYFARENTSLLKLGRTKFYGRVLLNTCINGSSELMSNISMSVVTIFYNYQLMTLEGENGIAAYGAIMYVSFIFIAVFIGFVVGSSPIVSFHYGAGNTDELKNMRKKCTAIVFAGGAVMTATALLLAVPLCKLYVGYDESLYALTLRGYVIFSFSFLFAGFNIFGSAFFTALNNGVISAIISFLRTIVFQCATVMLLPLIFATDGVWFSIIVAEILSLIVTLILISAKKRKYNY